MKDLEPLASEETADLSGTFLRALFVLSRTAPPNEGVRFRSFDLRPDRIRFDATAPAFADAEALVTAINTDGTFAASITDQRSDGSGWTFTVEMATGAGDAQ